MRIAKLITRMTLQAALIASVTLLWSCSSRTAGETRVSPSDKTVERAKSDTTAQNVKGSENVANKIAKTDDEWRKLLTAEQYRVTRECGTEPPFTGKYYHFKGEGTYLCVACGNELFSSGTKYDSGSGWPSFYAPLSEGNIEERTDKSHGMVRVEVRCARCGAHLGHVFEDGPAPTGLRYCINSAALNFVGKTDSAEKDDKGAKSEKADSTSTSEKGAGKPSGR
jgi:peptide-methionine (R)-S-oxide reductase